MRIITHDLKTKAIRKTVVVVREKSCLDAANITLGTSALLGTAIR